MVPLQQSSMQLPRVLFIVYWKTQFVIEKHQSTSSTDHGWFPHWEGEMLLDCWSSAVALTVLPRMPKSGSTPRQTFSTFLLRHRRSCQHTVLREQMRARSVPPYYLCCFYHQRCSRRASYTITDLPSHPSHSLFSLMHCGRRFSCTTRLLNPQAVRRFSS